MNCHGWLLYSRINQLHHRIMACRATEEVGVNVGQTFLSACFNADDVSAQMCFLCYCVKDNRIDGGFFDCAQNDMLRNNGWRNLSVRCRHKP